MELQVHLGHPFVIPGYLLKLNRALDLAGHLMVSYGFCLSTSESKLMFNPEMQSCLIILKCYPSYRSCGCSPHLCYWAYRDYRERVIKIMLTMVNDEFDFSIPGLRSITFDSDSTVALGNPLFIALHQRHHSPEFINDFLRGLRFKISLNSELARIWISNGEETTRINIAHSCAACNILHH